MILAATETQDYNSSHIGREIVGVVPLDVTETESLMDQYLYTAFERPKGNRPYQNIGCRITKTEMVSLLAHWTRYYSGKS